jgi:hypothetical protein
LARFVQGNDLHHLLLFCLDAAAAHGCCLYVNVCILCVCVCVYIYVSVVWKSVRMMMMVVCVCVWYGWRSVRWGV